MELLVDSKFEKKEEKRAKGPPSKSSLERLFLHRHQPEVVNSN